MALPARKRLLNPSAIEVYPIVKAPGNPYPERISVGRSRNCDVVLRDPRISKLHAHFTVGPKGEMSLIDLGSQNGTRLNSRQLPPHTAEPLASGDIIEFAGVTARFLNAERLYDLIR